MTIVYIYTGALGVFILAVIMAVASIWIDNRESRKDKR